MNAQAILTKIEEDARQSAAELLTDANGRAEEIKTASRKKIEKARAEMIAQAQKESAELEKRMLRMAELDDRKEMLARKRALIDEVFALSAQKLSAMEPAKARAFFLEEAEREAAGRETVVIGAQNAQWFDERFLSDLNDRLRQAGKPGELKLAKERRAGATGLLLLQDGAEINCTFGAMLDALRVESETEVAHILFD